MNNKSSQNTSEPQKPLFEIVRWSTMLATVLMVIFGYSDQLRLILSHKSTQGLSFWMILIGLWTWTSYALYGLLKKDYKIFWPNTAGTILLGIILLSFLFY